MSSVCIAWSCLYSCCLCSFGRVRHVNCSQRGLQSIPAGLPDDLMTLDLSWNPLDLDKLRKNLCNFRSLSSLSLSFSELTALSNIFQGCTSLLEVNLTGNRFTQLDISTFQGLENLRRLLGLETRSVLDKDVFQGLTNLKDLDLIYHGESLPEGLFNNLMIKSINLVLTKAEVLPEGLFEFGKKSLNTLQLVGEKVKVINHDLFDGLSVLKKLFLVMPQLQTLPENLFLIQLANLSVRRVANLQEVEITGIKSFPANLFRQLDNLESLQFKDIETFPKETFLSNLVNLKTLIISGGNITMIPSSWFKNLNSLKTLKIANAQLEKLEDDAFQGLLNLNYLDLSFNILKHVSHKNLKPLNRTLETLVLAGNRLSEFSKKNTESITLLRYLDLSENRLTTIYPDAFQGMRQLSVLYLSYNQISSLPINLFTDQFQLESLSLTNNYLSEFPVALLTLKNSLINLDLSFNQIRQIPAAQLCQFVNLEKINVIENPLHCDCDIMGFQKCPTILPEGICQTPKEFAGQDIKNIEVSKTCSFTLVESEASVKDLISKDQNFSTPISSYQPQTNTRFVVNDILFSKQKENIQEFSADVEKTNEHIFNNPQNPHFVRNISGEFSQQTLPSIHESAQSNEVKKENQAVSLGKSSNAAQEDFINGVESIDLSNQAPRNPVAQSNLQTESGIEMKIPDVLEPNPSDSQGNNLGSEAMLLTKSNDKSLEKDRTNQTLNANTETESNRILSSEDNSEINVSGHILNNKLNVTASTVEKTTGAAMASDKHLTKTENEAKQKMRNATTENSEQVHRDGTFVSAHENNSKAKQGVTVENVGSKKPVTNEVIKPTDSVKFKKNETSEHLASINPEIYNANTPQLSEAMNIPSTIKTDDPSLIDPALLSSNSTLEMEERAKGKNDTQPGQLDISAFESGQNVKNDRKPLFKKNPNQTFDSTDISSKAELQESFQSTSKAHLNPITNQTKQSKDPGLGTVNMQGQLQHSGVNQMTNKLQFQQEDVAIKNSSSNEVASADTVQKGKGDSMQTTWPVQNNATGLESGPIVPSYPKGLPEKVLPVKPLTNSSISHSNASTLVDQPKNIRDRNKELIPNKQNKSDPRSTVEDGAADKEPRASVDSIGEVGQPLGREIVTANGLDENESKRSESMAFNFTIGAVTAILVFSTAILAVYGVRRYQQRGSYTISDESFSNENIELERTMSYPQHHRLSRDYSYGSQRSL